MISQGFQGKEATKMKRLLHQNHLIAIQFSFKKLFAHQGCRSIDRETKRQKLSPPTQKSMTNRASLTPMNYMNTGAQIVKKGIAILNTFPIIAANLTEMALIPHKASRNYPAKEF